MRVLIIQTGTIGDLVFTSVLIRCLKAQLKNIHLTVIASQEGFGGLEQNPNVDSKHVHVSFLASYSLLRKPGFDYILNLTSSAGTILLSTALKGKVFGKGALFFLSERFRSRKERRLHRVEEYLAIAKRLGVKNDGKGLEYRIPDNDLVPRESLPDAYQSEFVVFCIGAKYETRRLPLSRMIELCDRINKPVILLGDQRYHNAASRVEDFFRRGNHSAHLEEGLRKLNKKTVVYNGCGKFTLNQQASLIQLARCVFAFDGDFIAVASAFHKEIISIWGNTVLDSGTYPYQTKFTVLENNRIKCRPCSSKGYEKCPLSHFKCMNDITFDFYLS
jgi:ADP-heptose:LPS heptosyltransferase